MRTAIDDIKRAYEKYLDKTAAMFERTSEFALARAFHVVDHEEIGAQMTVNVDDLAEHKIARIIADFCRDYKKTALEKIQQELAETN